MTAHRHRNSPLPLLLSACLLLAACVSTDGDRGGFGREGASRPDARNRADRREGEVFSMPAAGAGGGDSTDFGLTVVTNKGVSQGGPIEWIVIGGIAPGSSAAFARLAAGDEILAIDGVVVAELKRDVTRWGLFQRRPGDRIRLLVSTPAHMVPYFVVLTAGRQAPAR